MRSREAVPPLEAAAFPASPSPLLLLKYSSRMSKSKYTAFKASIFFFHAAVFVYGERQFSSTQDAVRTAHHTHALGKKYKIGNLSLAPHPTAC